MSKKEALAEELEGLRAEHRVLDEKIDAITGNGKFDDVEIQRLKKRKLMIKDQMTKIESGLLPDIIA